MNKFRNFFKVHTVIFYFFLFLFFPLSVKAAIIDGDNDDGTEGSSPTDNKNVVLTMKDYLDEYASFWSAGVWNGSAYKELDNPDSESIDGGYAALVDIRDSSGEGGAPGRTGKSLASEDVFDFEGYYEYDIKLSTFGEDAK